MSRPRSSSLSNSPLKFLIVITCVLISSGYHAAGHGELLMMERFDRWMETHSRTYATADEKLRRFEIYRSNMEFIEAKNREPGLTFQLGETEFTDLTHEEFLSMYTGGYEAPTTADLKSSVITTRAGDVTEGARETADLSATLPDSVDWRNKGAVTPAKHQGPCNSCWIFAAVATIESLHKIKCKKELITLSEQEVMDCYVSDNEGCSRRGRPLGAIDWVSDNGIASEAHYGPYLNESRSCKTTSKLKDVKIDESSVVYAEPGQRAEQALALTVVRNPVAVQFDPHDPCFQHYCHGIYTRRGPAKTYTHNLVIVGYGKNATGSKYWIAKNSWGESWGQKGFVQLEKDLPNSDDGLCGLAISPAYPVINNPFHPCSG